jgi:hypothetical protein
VPVELSPEDHVSDHQPENHYDDEEQAEADRQRVWDRTAQDTATDPHEPDFSRLRLARASLDNAFPQR